MTDPPAFPAVDDMVVGRLAELVPADHVGTVTPPDLADALPFIRVNVRGGPDDGVTDHARIDTEYFAATYTAARDGAEAVRQRLSTRRGGYAVSGGVVDKVTSSRAQEVVWAEDGGIRRFVATHTVDTRRNPP